MGLLCCGVVSVKMADHAVSQSSLLGAHEKWYLIHLFDHYGHSALCSSQGQYLHAEHPGYSVTLKPHLGDHVMWRMEEHSHQKVAFKSQHGTYLGAHPNGQVDQFILFSDSELWIKLPLEGDNMFAFLSSHGRYLSAN